MWAITNFLLDVLIILILLGFIGVIIFVLTAMIAGLIEAIKNEKRSGK